MAAQPDDEAVLAALDTAPAAYAVFYRRHVAGLLGYFLHRTHDAELAADLCAETFAAALAGAQRFDPARGPAVAWLYGIARRLLAHAERRGAVEDRARCRLGMAPLDLTDAAIERIEALAGSEAALAELPPEQRATVTARVLDERGDEEIALAAETSASVIRKRVSRGLAGDAGAPGGEAMSDDFVRDLEEELVAAAAFRAARRRRPRRAGRGVAPLRAAGALLVGVAVVAVAVLALVRGGGDGAADDPPAPPAGMTLALPAMLPLPACDEVPARDQPAADVLPPLAVFERPQGEPDGMPVDALPVTGFDARESRRPGREALKTEFTLVPSRGIRRDGRCPEAGDDGPGLCLVAGIAPPPRQRCFTATEVVAGRAVAQLGPALLIGVVPDGVTTVTLAAEGKRATAPVVENAYEAVLPGVRPGVPVTVTLARGRDCRPGVAPALRDRITALNEPAPPGNPLPHAALETLNWWTWQLDAVVPEGARYWGGADGVAFWVVPVVPKGGGECAPATHVCVVAVPDDAAADAQCVLEWPDDGVEWRVGPLLPGHAVIYGIVPDGVDEAAVTIGDEAARVEAGLNIIGGVLPFPYRDRDKPRVVMIPRGPAGAPLPRVVVVGATDAVLDRLADARYETSTADAAGISRRSRTAIYWDQRQVTREAAARVAGVVEADDRYEVRDHPSTPRPVLDLDAPVVVMVGMR